MAFIQYLTFDGTALPCRILMKYRWMMWRRIPAGRRRQGRTAGCSARRRSEHPGDVFSVGKMAEDTDRV